MSKGRAAPLTKNAIDLPKATNPAPPVRVAYLVLPPATWYTCHSVPPPLSKSVFANSVTPEKDVHRYTLRMAKEDSKIIYRGDWAREERAIMEGNGVVMLGKVITVELAQ